MAEMAEIGNKQNLFNNSGLFSNHYLENLIQKSPHWNDDALLPEVYQGIKEIYIKKGTIDLISDVGRAHSIT